MGDDYFIHRLKSNFIELTEVNLKNNADLAMTAFGKGVGILFGLATRLTLFVFFPVSYVIAHICSIACGVPIRVHEEKAKHIGGWVRDIDGYLRGKNKGVHSGRKDLFLVNPKKVANPFFLRLMKRKVDVVTNSVARFLLLPLARFPNKFSLNDYGNLSYMNLPAVPHWFSDEDHAEGELLLRRLGMIPEESWYVCFFARDEAYNEKTSPKHSLAGYRKYHACRNTDINTHIKAIKYVISKGGYAIRMGSIVKKKVSFEHPRFIDYPFSDFRSDFADIYLSSHCKFFIGDGSGLMDMPGMLDTPVAMINYILHKAVERPSKELLLMPKLIKYADSGAYLRLKEVFELLDDAAISTLVAQTRTMEKFGLVFEDNSEDDILMITEAIYRRAVEKTVSDDVWNQWVAGSPRALAIDKDCNIWEPFLNCHETYFMAPDESGGQTS